MSFIPSILIIDDNPDNLSVLAELFLAMGAGSVRQVPSAEAALEVLAAESFSIIVSDYQLEGMNGVEFLECLRQKGNRTPVVMLSGAPDKQGVIRATQLERVDFFPKPFRMAELSCAMERLLAA